MEKTILFCIPYAGGSAMLYTKWKKYLDASIEVYPLELTGRGKRFKEPFYANVTEAVDDLFPKIKELSHKAPYALYGHSMGSILAYELYYRIEELKHPKPVHLFFSGRIAPHIVRDERPIYNLPDDEFVAKIIKLGGTPREIFENIELQNFFVPIIRNDYRLIDTYKYIARDTKIDCDLTVLAGKEDDMTTEEIEGWRLHADQSCRIHYFQGGHFFINEFTSDIVEIINDSLTNNSNGLSAVYSLREIK